MNQVKGILISCLCAWWLFSIERPALPQAPTPTSAVDGAASPLGFKTSEEISRDRMPDPSLGLIRIDVTVTDQAGKPVSGLSENNFTLLDNGTKQSIVTFQSFERSIAQPADSLEIVFVIDELNMLPSPQNGKDELSQATHEVETFLRANRGVLEKPTIIYRLTANGLFATPHPLFDGNELADEMNRPDRQHWIWSPSVVAKDIGNMGKGGEVSSRISHSLVALGSIAIEERRRPGRKLVFWIGNGWQVEKRKAAGLPAFSIELLTRMREARINLWGASEWPVFNASGKAVPVEDYADKQYLAGPQSSSFDPTDLSYLSLPVIAARSGGGVLNTPHNLAALIGKHIEEETSYYSLTFDPPRTDTIDEYRHLSVELDKPGLTPHLMQDYYDEPVFYDQPPASKPVSVAQLNALIANANDASGDAIAHQLESVVLTERLNRAKWAGLEKLLHGKKAREALQVLADQSAFFPPPGDEILSTPPPEPAEQRQMISRAISYIHNAIPSLPDLFATRETVQFHQFLPKSEQTWKTAALDQSLHEGETTTASIRFHNGKERVEQKSVKNAPESPGSEQLRTIGTFGPILATVMAAVTSPQGELAWARWETGPAGPLAVFRYRIRQETPFFTAGFCCLAYDFDSVPFQSPAPFHGEIAVDPTSGSILRLTIQADLEWRLPLMRSDVMVEYAPVQRGSRTFICPTRSVSISRQRRTVVIDEWGEGFRVYAPFETLLNQMSFEKYRIFGSTSRILPDFTEVPEKK